MSEDLPFTIARNRRRQKNFALEQPKIKSESSSVGTFSNAFATFLSTPATSIWNSAQTKLTPNNSSNSLRDNHSSSSEPSNDYRVNSISSEEMPCRERTAEFRTTAKSFQMKWHANGHAGSRPTKQKVVQESVQFNQLAKRIGRDLSQTCAKMEKLSELAKRKSLFDDRMTEIEELTQIIKQDICGLNKQIAGLQDFARRSQNGATLRAQCQNHSKSVVVGLQSRLAEVSSDFQQVLEVRTENLKLQNSRRKKFNHSQPVPSNFPPSASSGKMGSILLADEASANSVFLDMDHLERQRVQQQMTLIDEQESYVQARSSTMESIESSIAELGSIFQQLASLVAEQGETITRIDSNVEETGLHVEAAHMELLRYFRNISRNRWLMIKVFGVLVVFFIIFIVFLT